METREGQLYQGDGAGEFQLRHGQRGQHHRHPPGNHLDRPARQDGIGFALTAAKQAGTGDSHANIEYLNAPNTDLGSINIDGDLHRIDGGSDGHLGVGLKSLDRALAGARGFRIVDSMLRTSARFTSKAPSATRTSCSRRAEHCDRRLAARDHEVKSASRRQRDVRASKSALDDRRRFPGQGGASSSEAT